MDWFPHWFGARRPPDANPPRDFAPEGTSLRLMKLLLDQLFRRLRYGRVTVNY